MKALRSRRKERGECTRCGKKHLEGYSFLICSDCKEYRKLYVKTYVHGYTVAEIAFVLFMKKKTPPKGDFGKRLKKLMLNNIDSPKSLAIALNVSTKTVDSWLYRDQIPLKSRWNEIANHFNCTIDDLGL